MDPRMMKDNENTEPTPDSETGPGEPPQGAEPGDKAQEGSEPTKDSESAGSSNSILDGEPPNVTPEEQKQYDTVVGKALELLYADDRLPTLVDKLKNGTDNISGAIGHTAAMTLLTISRTVESQGQQIPEDVLYAAGQEIVGQITDIAVAAKLVDPSGKEKVAEAALYEGLRVWGQQMGANGQIDGNKQQEAAGLLQQAGIPQDTSKLPGHGPAAAPGAPGQPVADAAQAAQQSGPPQPGIVNQAMGAPQ